jgi:hypothetical protein
LYMQKERVYMHVFSRLNRLMFLISEAWNENEQYEHCIFVRNLLKFGEFSILMPLNITRQSPINKGFVTL